MPTIATIGVYEFDAAGFIDALAAAGVTRVMDIRQRRGVRGARYAWANAHRLQALLAGAPIGYEPTGRLLGGRPLDARVDR